MLFDAAASTDPDGAITGFEWDFGDGTTADRRAGAAPLRRARHLRGPARGHRRRRRRQQPRRRDPHRRGHPAAGRRPDRAAAALPRRAARLDGRRGRRRPQGHLALRRRRRRRGPGGRPRLRQARRLPGRGDPRRRRRPRQQPPHRGGLRPGQPGARRPRPAPTASSAPATPSPSTPASPPTATARSPAGAGASATASCSKARRSSAASTRPARTTVAAHRDRRQRLGLRHRHRRRRASWSTRRRSSTPAPTATRRSGAANDTLLFDAGGAIRPGRAGRAGRRGTSATAPPPPAPSPATATPRRANTPSASRRATPPASPAASPATRRSCAPGAGVARRMRFPLRAKFFVFATLIATAPLALVGQNLVRIARDELKSAANEDLTGVAGDLAGDFDTTVEGRWLTPLRVIRNGVDSRDLGVEQKISLLTLGLSQIPDVVALQLSVEGSDLPILVTDQDFSRHLADGRARPDRDAAHPGRRPSTPIRRDGRYGELLPAPARGDRRLARDGGAAAPHRARRPQRDASPPRSTSRRSAGWCATTPSPAAARSRSSTPRAAPCSSSSRGSLADRAIVANAAPLIVTSARPEAIEGYVRPDGAGDARRLRLPRRLSLGDRHRAQRGERLRRRQPHAAQPPPRRPRRLRRRRRRRAPLRRPAHRADPEDRRASRSASARATSRPGSRACAPATRSAISPAG